jgi:hypothetical protein
MLLIVLNPTKREGQEYALAQVSLSCEDEVVNTLTKGHIPTRNSDQKIV